MAGSHTSAGAYTVAGGATLAGTGTIGATHVTFASNAYAQFDLDAGEAIALTANDAVLTGNGATIRLSAPALSGMDDIVLFDLTGNNAAIASGFNPQPEWVGVPPSKAQAFKIVTEGTRIPLRNQGGTIFMLR